MTLLVLLFILTLDRTVLSIEICGLDDNNNKLVAVQNLDKNVESNGCSKPSFIQVLIHCLFFYNENNKLTTLKP